MEWGRRTELASFLGGYLINVAGSFMARFFRVVVVVYTHMDRGDGNIELDYCPLPLAFLSVFIHHLSCTGDSTQHTNAGIGGGAARQSHTAIAGYCRMALTICG